MGVWKDDPNVRIIGYDPDKPVSTSSDGVKERLDVSASIVGFSGYVCAEVDKTDDTYYYYGFTDSTGAWYIMRKTIGDPSSYRFVSGTSGFSSAWTNRTTQTYDYYHEAF